MQSFQDQVVVITGGASGIGKGVATALAARGAEVVVCDIQAPEGIDLPYVSCDVTSESSWSSVRQYIEKHYRSIDALVCAHGIVSEFPVVDLSPGEWDRIITVNLRGTFMACHTLLPLMLNQSKGSIVNFSTGYIVNGYRNGAHYAASKAGISSLTKSLALEVAGEGIRVNAIAPGPVSTPMLTHVTQDKMDSWQENVVRRIPMGRVGNVEDITGPVLFLLSDFSRYITGQTIHVNGGLYNV